MKNTLIIIGMLIFISCASSKFIPPVANQADADRVATKYPGITIADLNEGKMLFEANCDKCHQLKKPSSKSEIQWNSIIPKMSAKANKKAGKEVISPANQESILKYVVAMSGAKKGA